jgi:hypothetical protein
MIISFVFLINITSITFHNRVEIAILDIGQILRVNSPG